MIAEYKDDEEIVLNKKVGHLPLFERGMFDFFLLIYVSRLFRCRSPPLVNLILKISNWLEEK